MLRVCIYAYVNIFDIYMFHTLFKVLSLPATRAKSEVFQQAINWDPQRFVTRSCRIIFFGIFVGGSSLMNMFCQICYLNLFDWWWPLTYSLESGLVNPTLQVGAPFFKIGERGYYKFRFTPESNLKDRWFWYIPVLPETHEWLNGG